MTFWTDEKLIVALWANQHVRVLVPFELKFTAAHRAIIARLHEVHETLDDASQVVFYSLSYCWNDDHHLEQSAWSGD